MEMGPLSKVWRIHWSTPSKNQISIKIWDWTPPIQKKILQNWSLCRWRDWFFRRVGRLGSAPPPAQPKSITSAKTTKNSPARWSQSSVTIHQVIISRKRTTASLSSTKSGKLSDWSQYIDIFYFRRSIMWIGGCKKNSKWKILYPSLALHPRRR